MGGPVQGQEVDSVIFLGPFQLSKVYDSVIALLGFVNEIWVKANLGLLACCFGCRTDASQKLCFRVSVVPVLLFCADTSKELLIIFPITR